MGWDESKSLVVDITGMMRPHLLYLLAHLFRSGAHSFDALYSEPQRYKGNEATLFSKGEIREVRQVEAYEGVHVQDASNDLLIIGTGYDHELIASVAESKESSRKRQLFGLPALRPHMYQENVLRAAVAGESVGGGEEGLGPELFAAAYDPFANAAVLGKEVERQKQRQGITNLYLSPLGTKAQVLGFDVYFLTELRESAASMIFPFREGYESETGVGISRTWRYRVEFAAMTA